MKKLIQKFPIFSFYVLAYALTWMIAVPLMWSKRGWVSWDLPHSLEGLAAFGPFAAALISTALIGGKQAIRSLLANCVHWRFPVIWWLVTLLSPFVILGLAILLTPADVASDAQQNIGAFILSTAFLELVIVGGLYQGLGEEPGWRGFALPKLRAKYGPLLASLVLFPVWLCWHLPAFVARPEFNLGAWLGFSLGILSAAIWLTWIYDATRSALTAIVWHLLINVARGIAMVVSMQTFLLFGQVVAGTALIIVIYWLVKRPGPYGNETLQDKNSEMA